MKNSIQYDATWRKLAYQHEQGHKGLTSQKRRNDEKDNTKMTLKT